MYYISICAIIKDEDLYLNEWIEWHINNGVEHFYLYDNCSAVPQQNCISSKNIEYCTVIPYPVTHGNPQLECYRRFLNDYGSESKWVAIIDADEFIRVIDGTRLPDFLRQYEKHDALYAGWITYNADGRISNNGLPVRERFKNTVAYKKGLPCGKSIIRPEKVTRMGIHIPEPIWFGTQDIVDENFSYVWDCAGYEPPLNKIVIDHYFTKSWEEWQHKINRGTADNSGFRKMEEFFYYNPDLVDAIKNGILHGNPACDSEQTTR
jgi:hypothetical protein